jgi:predicted permease
LNRAAVNITMRWLTDSFTDIRYGLRRWAKNPLFTTAAISSLAIGIGANTAIFSIVSGVLLRPLPFADPQSLALLYETQPRSKAGLGFDGPVVFQDFDEWRRHSKLLAGMAAYSASARNYQAAGAVEQVPIVSAERGLFGLLGVSPILGRTFRADDPANVAVASYRFWKTYLHGEPSAAGRAVMLDGEEFRLIGVMPETFQFPYSTGKQGLWLPWSAPPDLQSHPNRRLEAVIGRLKPGTGTDEARQELNRMDSASRGGRVVRVERLQDVVTARARESLLVLLGAVGMVLLVACLNVANLLLAQAASRAREISIRASVGAGASRLARQFLTESLLLAFAGGATGFAIGIPGRRLLVQLAAAQIPRADEIAFDWRVFLFLLAICAMTGAGFGLAPAIAAARGFSRGLARRGIPSAARDGLVIAEIALAFMLLVAAGLLLRTFVNLQNAGAGLRAGNVLTAHVAVSGPQQAMALEERVSQIPGVRAAGMVSMLPLQNSGWTAGFTIPGRPTIYQTELRYVTPGYFRAMGIPLRRGRELSAHDVAGPERAIVVNEAFARLYFPGEEAVGRMTDRGRIVGVIGDVHQASLREAATPEMYFAVAQNFAQIRQIGSTLAVRTNGRSSVLPAAIRAAVRDVAPGQALFRVESMRQVVDESLASPKLYVWMIGLFAAIALLLAAAGVYGVIAYLVTLRTREFGIRMALGARNWHIAGHVIGRGLWLTALGLAMGVVGAIALTGVLRGVLYGVGATDGLTFGVVAAMLGAVALAACLGPAHRAAHVNPAISLRFE